MQKTYLIIVYLVASMVVSGCGSLPFVGTSARLQDAGPVVTECADGLRLFEHPQLATNPLCVPEKPQRIVVLDRLSFETLMVLGRQPSGTYSGYIENFQIDFPYLAEDVEGITNLGALESLKVETLIATKPDLIIGDVDRHGPFYADLAAIAPTTLYEIQHSGQWQDIAAFVADIANSTTELERIVEQYEARIMVLQDTLGESVATEEISVVRIMPNNVRLYAKDSFLGSIIAEAGLPRPASQDLNDTELQDQHNSSTFYNISDERIDLADGDVIFIWATGYTPEIAADAEARLVDLRDDPLWGSLDAVQQEQVFEVGGYWIGSSFIAAHAMLDDLFVYVAEVDPQEVAPNPFHTE